MGSFHTKKDRSKVEDTSDGGGFVVEEGALW